MTRRFIPEIAGFVTSDFALVNPAANLLALRKPGSIQRSWLLWSLWLVVVATAIYGLSHSTGPAPFQTRIVSEENVMIRVQSPNDPWIELKLLLIACRNLVPWILALPVIVWLATRFRFEARRWPLSLGIHLGAAVALSYGAQALTRLQLDREPSRKEVRVFLREQGDPSKPLSEARPPHFWTMEIMRWLRAHSDIGFYWLVVSLTNAFLYFRFAAERERRAFELEARLTAAQLQTLRMQLQPHFLFNTLHAISSLVHTDPKAADEMINSLSDLLRMTLHLADKQEIPLRDELDFLDRYLFLQQTRFHDKLNVTREIAFDSLDCMVPTLLLQPLVENAIKHGIEPAARPALIEIRAAIEDGALELAVLDDGIGSAPELTEGVGLRNTRARLQQLYGTEQTFRCGPGPGGGFQVFISIPARTCAPVSAPQVHLA